MAATQLARWLHHLPGYQALGGFSSGAVAQYFMVHKNWRQSASGGTPQLRICPILYYASEQAMA